jgi:hypothetical protein
VLLGVRLRGRPERRAGQECHEGKRDEWAHVCGCPGSPRDGRLLRRPERMIPAVPAVERSSSKV